MSQQNQDVTEAELALLQALWDSGPSTIRQLDRIFSSTLEALGYEKYTR